MICFAISKCEVFLHDWWEPVLSLTDFGDRFEIANSFKYIESLTTPGRGVEEDILSRIAKTRTAFANLRCLWCLQDVRLFLKGRMYNPIVCSVLHGCRTCPIRIGEFRQLSVFDHRCLGSIARVWWEHRVSNVGVRGRLLGVGSRPLPGIIAVLGLRWLRHVLPNPVHRLPLRILLRALGDGG